MRPTVLIAVAATLVAVACGMPKIGDACNQTGFLCSDKSTAMQCLTGKWTGLPCKGVGGCSTVGSQITCDMSGDSDGDACASTVEGLGLCTADGGATLECRGGVLHQTNTCASCTVSNGQVVCTQ